MDDFEEAKDKVLMGAERKSMIIADDEKRVTAYHEAGHALVAHFMPAADPLHKVTIIPRGRSLGVTQQLPLDDRRNYTRTYLKTQITVLLAGRIAEELVMNEMTTGAGNDFERVTDIARRMVTEWGMSEQLGPLTFGGKNEEVFLGRDFVPAQGLLRRHRLADRQRHQGNRRRRLFNGHRAPPRTHRRPHEVAEALLTRETLDGEEVALLAAGKSLPEVKFSADDFPSDTGAAVEAEADKPSPRRGADPESRRGPAGGRLEGRGTARQHIEGRRGNSVAAFAPSFGSAHSFGSDSTFVPPQCPRSGRLRPAAVVVSG